MRRANRLRSSADIRRAVREGRSVARAEFVLYHIVRGKQGPPRFGFAVPRRVGRAVDRNRSKRLLREAARELAPDLVPAVDIVIIARPPVTEVGLGGLRTALEESAARAGLIRTYQQEEGTPG